MNPLPIRSGLRTLAFGLLLALPTSLSLRATTPDAPGPTLVARYGVLGVGDSESVDPVGALELRLPTDWHGLQPWVGLNLTDSRTWWAGAGLVYHLDLTPRLRATLGSGPAYYQGDPEHDLGLDLEFYSFLEITRELRNRDALGLRVGHLSNAGLGRRNPGSETISLVYTRQLTSLTRWGNAHPTDHPTSPFSRL